MIILCAGVGFESRLSPCAHHFRNVSQSMRRGMNRIALFARPHAHHFRRSSQPKVPSASPTSPPKKKKRKKTEKRRVGSRVSAISRRPGSRATSPMSPPKRRVGDLLQIYRLKVYSNKLEIHRFQKDQFTKLQYVQHEIFTNSQDICSDKVIKTSSTKKMVKFRSLQGLIFQKLQLVFRIFAIHK